LDKISGGVEIPSIISPHASQQNTCTPSGRVALTKPHREQILLDAK